MMPATFEQLLEQLASTSSELGREIGWLASTPATERKEQLKRIERARQKRDVAARALRLARLLHLHGHPQL